MYETKGTIKDVLENMWYSTYAICNECKKDLIVAYKPA